MRTRSLLFGLLFGVSMAVVSMTQSVVSAPTGEAQARPGEFSLRQAGVVGWIYVTGDGATEWWAYIDDGSYQWADQGNTLSNLWDLKAEYIGAGNYANYAAWKSAVLARPAALGKPIKFEKHAVTSETVQN